MGVEENDVLDLNGWIASEADYPALFGEITTPDDEVIVMPQPEFKEYTVTAWPYLFMRESASTNSKKLGLYYQNAKVNISSVSNGWAKIYGQPGYISEKYLK